MRNYSPKNHILKLLSKFVLATSIFLFLGNALTAQQVYRFNQVVNHRYALNPAASGVSDNLEFVSSYRKQWSGMEGSPETFYASVNMPLSKTKQRVYPDRYAYQSGLRYRKQEPYHHSIGFMAMGDRFGAFQKSRFLVSYGFHLPVFSDFKLAFSPRIGFSQTGIDPSKTNVRNLDDPTFAYFTSSELSSINFDTDLGFWLYNERIFAGYSAIQVIPSSFTNLDATFDGSQRMHSYFIVGTHYYVQYLMGSKKNETKHMILTPAIIGSNQGFNSPFSLDFSAEFEYQTMFKAGLSYNFRNNIGFWLGFFPLKDVEFCYAYNAPTSVIRMNQNGTHEIILRLNLFKGAFEGYGKARF
jgi:type IX secretion system PorP/SprF family membrane protein